MQVHSLLVGLHLEVEMKVGYESLKDVELGKVLSAAFRAAKVPEDLLQERTGWFWEYLSNGASFELALATSLQEAPAREAGIVVFWTTFLGFQPED